MEDDGSRRPEVREAVPARARGSGKRGRGPDLLPSSAPSALPGLRGLELLLGVPVGVRLPRLLLRPLLLFGVLLLLLMLLLPSLPSRTCASAWLAPRRAPWPLLRDVGVPLLLALPKPLPRGDNAEAGDSGRPWRGRECDREWLRRCEAAAPSVGVAGPECAVTGAVVCGRSIG